MSLKPKKKICTGCNTEQFIFSGGKCKRCASKKKPRKENRECYPEFFERHISIIKTGRHCCQECGTKLIGYADNVAHILSKSIHKEVACNDDNVLYLCGRFEVGGLNCHAKFDSSLSAREKMSVFSLAAEKTERIKDLVIKQSKEFLQLCR